VLGPSRPVPTLGAAVRVLYFGGEAEAGTILALGDEGRRLQIQCESGERIEFVLNPASARFLAAGAAGGPRLELLDDRR
jgi:hypothetical protein